MKKIILCFAILVLGKFTSMAQKPEVATLTDSAANKTYIVVQVNSEFPGGLQGWTSYLQNNLNTRLGNRYIKIPKGEKSAKVTAKVSFIVGINGDITDIDVTNKDSIHPKFVEEAIRVIKEGPKWTPAQQSEVPDMPGLTDQQKIDVTIRKGLAKVASRKQQSITWQVGKE